MSLVSEEIALPDFEIDHPERFAQFMLHGAREVRFYLRLLARQRSVLTAYLDDGHQFFLTSILAIDETTNQLYLDSSNTPENNRLSERAERLTLVTNLDRVKIQIRLPGLRASRIDGKDALLAPMPESMLRLQRREFFRLEPPIDAPIVCQLANPATSGPPGNLQLQLSDISGGGLCLIARTDQGDHFPRDSLFQHCRLEIPGEGVVQVNLRVRKTVEISGQDGDHDLRIGCEFVNLPGTRLAFIERYIARIERERKARASGLAD